MSIENEKGIGWQNEPDPTMRSLNPFTQARNISMKKQSEIAEALNAEPVDIMRLEQAIYDRIPPVVAKYYEDELGLPKGWPAGYKHFQLLVRRSAPRPIHGVWQMPPGELNFRRWRLHNWPTMSSMSWCKAFCVHPAALHSVEKGEQPKIPHQILSALIEANIMSDEQARNFAYRVRTAMMAHNGGVK